MVGDGDELDSVVRSVTASPKDIPMAMTKASARVGAAAAFHDVWIIYDGYPQQSKNDYFDRDDPKEKTMFGLHPSSKARRAHRFSKQFHIFSLPTPCLGYLGNPRTYPALAIPGLVANASTIGTQRKVQAREDVLGQVQGPGQRPHGAAG